jgi:hypothetical protein
MDGMQQSNGGYIPYMKIPTLMTGHGLYAWEQLFERSAASDLLDQAAIDPALHKFETTSDHFRSLSLREIVELPLSRDLRRCSFYSLCI